MRVAAGEVLASRNVTAKRCRAAGLNRAHRFELAKADVTPVGCTPAGTVLAEDVRKLQCGTGHDSPAIAAANLSPLYCAAAGRAGSSPHG